MLVYHSSLYAGIDWVQASVILIQERPWALASFAFGSPHLALIVTATRRREVGQRDRRTRLPLF